MDDLTMTRLVADAMGYQCAVSAHDVTGEIVSVFGGPVFGKYDPLHDDAQCMALVKRFKVDCVWASETGNCFAQCGDEGQFNCEDAGLDLNRAIVTCVARLTQKESRK